MSDNKILICFYLFFSDSKGSDSSGEDDSDDEEQNGNIEVYNPAMFRFWLSKNWVRRIKYPFFVITLLARISKYVESRLLYDFIHIVNLSTKVRQ